MEPNLTYVYPHTRVQSLVSILRTTVYHAFPVVTENRQNERDFMKGNILISNNIRFKVTGLSLSAVGRVEQEDPPPGSDWLLFFRQQIFSLTSRLTSCCHNMMTVLENIEKSYYCKSYSFNH